MDFNKTLENAGNAKINEYVERVLSGESEAKILEGLPESFRKGIESGLDKELIPPQYSRLDAESLDFIWTIPEYVDPEKTKSEKARKAAALEHLRIKENISEKSLEAAEEAEGARQDIGISKIPPVPENSEERDEYNSFRVKNGETDIDFYWYEYRNQKAKELKDSGQFEWGKERLYFDVRIEDCAKLRDLCFTIAGEHKLPIAFKHIDEAKTSALNKDGKETRFVANFASLEDAQKFYKLLSAAPEYQALSSERQLDYKGVRLDRLAEYASGFREMRGALERVVKASKNADGLYEYPAEDGRTMRISEEQYLNFKARYDEISKKMQEIEAKWRNI